MGPEIHEASSVLGGLHSNDCMKLAEDIDSAASSSLCRLREVGGAGEGEEGVVRRVVEVVCGQTRSWSTSR